MNMVKVMKFGHSIIMIVLVIIIIAMSINVMIKIHNLLHELVPNNHVHQTPLVVESSNVFNATHYAGSLKGSPMAWNEIPYDPFELTCAHSMYPFGTVLKVTNTENGRTVDVIVSDRHDYKTDIDLSMQAWTKLRNWDWNDSGNMPVTMEVVR